MAKVTGPLMSIDESGAFADTLGLCPVEGDQLQQAEDQTTKDAWNQAASGKPLSGFNLYVGEYVSYRIANGGVTPPSPFLPS